MKKILALTVAFLFSVMNVGLTAGEVLAASKGVEKALVRTGEISGTVSGAQGEALAGAVLTVHDGEGKAVASVTTDEKGSFSGITLPAGDYVLSVDGRISVPMTASPEHTVACLNIVIPADYSAGKAEGGGFSLFGLGTGASLAVIAGVAVGGALIIANNTGGSDCP